MKNSDTKLKNFFEKLALFLYRKAILVLIIFVIISVGVGYIIFQLLILNPLEEDFNPAATTPTPNYELLNNLQKEESDLVQDPFRGDGGVVEERQEDDETEEEVDKSEEDLEETAEDLEVEEMTDDQLESVLVDNLFELYEFTDGELPSISERAVVWEDLGLGDREEYRGTYSQNILFLERLVEEID